MVPAERSCIFRLFDYDDQLIAGLGEVRWLRARTTAYQDCKRTL
jgi:hypothetical protein